MRVVPNWRFLILLTAALVVAGLAVHLTHRWQVGRQSGVFLREADAAHERKDAGREIAYLQRYLRAHPGDLDTRERLGRRLCASSVSPKQLLEGYLVLQDVLRQDVDRDELRRYAATLAMQPQLAMYAEAEYDLKLLSEKRPGDAELEELRGNCLVAAGNFKEAVQHFDQAAKLQPDRVTAYGSRAVVLRHPLVKKSEDADDTIVRMLSHEPNRQRFRTYTILAEYWRMYFRPDQSAKAAAEKVWAAQKLAPEAKVADAIADATVAATRLAPDELDVILLAAGAARDRWVALARSRRTEESREALDEARGHLARGIERYRLSPSVYQASASLELAAGRPAEAVAEVKKGLDAIPDSVELTLALLDYQIRAGDARAAASTLDRLKSAGLPPAVGEYHDARLLMLDGRHFDAARVLDRVRRELPHDPAMTREANLLLGRCYQQFGDADGALAAFRKAIPIDPTDPHWVPAMYGVAEAEAAQGRADAALATYRKIKDRASGAWLPVARLEMIQALQTPKPDWRATEEAVAAAERALPDSPEVAVLRADLSHFQGKAEVARRTLAAARAAHPKVTSVWLATAAQHEREGKLDEAAESLAATEKTVGDSPELRLAKARLWVAAKEPDLATRLTGLGTDGEKFGRERHRRLLRGLAELAAAAGVWEAAGRLWDQVVAVAPDDLTAQLVRFDRAVVANDEPAMDRVRAEVERIDGEAGLSARLVKALRLVWKAQRRDDRSGLDEAAILLDGLARERAGWARLALARAVVHDMRKDFTSAAALYQQAFEGGEANPQAVRRLMELLTSGGRDAEAEAVFRKLSDSSAASADVQRLAAEVSLRTNNPKDALERSKQAVSETSTNPTDHIWVGQMHVAAGERGKAEVSFRRAVALRPDSSDARLTLVQYLTEAGRKDEAAKEFADAKEKVAATDRPLFLARGHAVLGDTDAAVEAFRVARQASPTDPRIVRAEAEFLFHAGRLTDAREAFHRVLGLRGMESEEVEYARRMLLICYATGGDPESTRRGLEILGLAENGVIRPLTGTETPAQQRTRAVALALQPDRTSKKEAVAALEAIRDKLTPADLFLLAQLYAAAGDRPKARLVLSDLVRVAGRVPVYVAYYALWLLREKDLRAAEEWVDRFAKLQPDTLLSAELTARLKAAKGEPNAARAALLPRAEGPKAAVGPVAHICEQIGLYDDADALYRRLWEENKSTRPETGLVLAAYHNRRGKTDEALKLCDTVRKNVPAAAVGEVAVHALYAAEAPSKEAMKTVAGWLEEAAKAAGGQTRTTLVGQLAAVRNLQGDYAGAIDLYQRVLAANEKDALAMNNLAFLLSTHQGKHDDALALLDRAKRVIGRNPDLDDTEAMVRLNRGEIDAALKLLNEGVERNSTGVAQFHRALAFRAGKREKEAREAWELATQAGLSRADLHPLEWAGYDRMKKDW